MALVGFPLAVAGAPGEVHTTAKNVLGTHSRDGLGNEYVYLQGVADTVAGSWVVIGAGHTTALLTAGQSGCVAIATAAIVASRYGWYQVKGFSSIALAGSNGTIVSGGGQLMSGVTSEGLGRVVIATGDSFGATAEFIYGAWSYSGQPDSDSAAAGTPGADLITVLLNYPFLAPLTAAV